MKHSTSSKLALHKRHHFQRFTNHHWHIIATVCFTVSRTFSYRNRTLHLIRSLWQCWMLMNGTLFSKSPICSLVTHATTV